MFQHIAILTIFQLLESGGWHKVPRFSLKRMADLSLRPSTDEKHLLV